MNEILKYKSYETSNSINDISVQINKISKNYNYYLKNVKLNSDLLKSSLRNDPLRKNIN